MCVARYGFGEARGDLLVDAEDLVVERSEQLADVLVGWLGR